MSYLIEDISIRALKENIHAIVSRTTNAYDFENSFSFDLFLGRLEKKLNHRSLLSIISRPVSNYKFKLVNDDEPKKNLVGYGWAITMHVNVQILLYVSADYLITHIEAGTVDVWIREFTSLITHELLHYEQIRRNKVELEDEYAEDREAYFASGSEIMAWAKDAVEWDIAHGGSLDEPLPDNPAAKPYFERPQLLDRFLQYYMFYVKDLN